MKIAFFFDEPDYFGGAGSLLLKQAKLMSFMHEVLVVIPINEEGVENPKCSEWCEKSGLRHIGLKYKTAFNFREIDLLDSVRSADQICQLISEENVDFLHSAQINVAVELASRKMHIPHLMNIYQLRKEEFLFKQADIYAHYHLCDSEMYSSLWSQEMNIVSECMRPLSPLENKRECEIRCKDSYTIVMLGIVCERKNQLTAILALERLKSRLDLHLIIAGDYDNAYGQKCMDYVKNHNLEHIITFQGFVTDVESLLLHSDWFLLVSTDESFPSSMVEAVSYNLPVITTPVAGVPEVFKDGINAFVSEDYSLNAIMYAIEACYNYCRDARIMDIQKNATETWNNYFAPDINLKKLNDYYHRIVSDYKDNNRENHVDRGLIKEVEETERRIAEKCNNHISLMGNAFYYHYLLKKLHAKGNKKAYIWGTGMIGHRTYDFLTNLAPNIEIIGFLDSYKEGYCQELPISKFENVVLNCDDPLVFIAFSGDVWTSVELLEKKGLVFADDIWIMS